MISSEFFHEHPEQFYDFYFHEMVYERAQPNDAHLALAKLEEMGIQEGDTVNILDFEFDYVR